MKTSPRPEQIIMIRNNYFIILGEVKHVYAIKKAADKSSRRPVRDNSSPVGNRRDPGRDQTRSDLLVIVENKQRYASRKKISNDFVSSMPVYIVGGLVEKYMKLVKVGAFIVIEGSIKVKYIDMTGFEFRLYALSIQEISAIESENISIIKDDIKVKCPNCNEDIALKETICPFCDFTLLDQNKTNP